MSLQNSALQTDKCKAAIIKAHVGITLSEGCIVESLVEGFPAHKSGLITVGDRLLAVQGRDVTACSLQDAHLGLMGNQVLYKNTVFLRIYTGTFVNERVACGRVELWRLNLRHLRK
jgi:hypothetical protein